ncbi:MAG TPA: dihydrofolate reductase family protein [Candidatus Dormibacteraeota bacterium]|nr:dihydrofolate reductase family protein [Candidatus Dormibacteraeota bacterium]
MRRLYSYMFMSLDGVIESPERWHFSRYSQEMGADLSAHLESAGAMLLGRTTYEAFAGYWPQQTSEVPFADVNNNIRKYVVSTTLRSADWNNTAVINHNVVATIQELKSQKGGDLHIAGSPTLVRTMLSAGLLDSLRLQVSPVIVGSGLHLFPDGTTPKELHLVETKTLPQGVLVLDYRVLNARGDGSGVPPS